MARLGMDVDVVESVGKQLNSQSQSVTSLIKTVDRLVASADAHWYGTRGREFVNAWRNVHRPALVAAASAVEGLGRSALQNASAQRRVSVAATSAGSTLGGARAGTVGLEHKDWATAGTFLFDVTDWLTSVARDPETGKKLFHGNLEGMKALSRVGKWVPVLGGIFGGADLADGAGRGDEGAMGGAVVDLALVGAGVATGVAGAPVVIPLGVLKTYVDVTIPYSEQSQDDLLNYQSREMFGRSTTELTPSEAEALAQRYSGVIGPMNMISDQMDYSYDKLSNSVAQGADNMRKFGGWVGSKFPSF